MVEMEKRVFFIQTDGMTQILTLVLILLQQKSADRRDILWRLEGGERGASHLTDPSQIPGMDTLVDLVEGGP